MLGSAASALVQEAAFVRQEIRVTRDALFRDARRIAGAPAEAAFRQLCRRSPADLRLAASHEPQPFSDHLADLAELGAQFAALCDDPAQRRLLFQAADQRARVLRIAVLAERERQQQDRAQRAREALYARAAASARHLTPGEQKRLTILDASSVGSSWHHSVTSAAVRDEVLEVITTMRLREARAQLRAGLLLTGQMRDILSEATPALLHGDPVLFLGETGGAKTALAVYLSQQVAGVDAEIISGFGDVTTAQVIGAHELRSEQGATVSGFVAGPLLRAMAEGRPIILDEINAMPAEFLKRLNRILQLRPGDEFHVQENAGATVRIAQGFAILATANEQTAHRYRGIDRLSAELVNRFGANTYRIHYPDIENAFDDVPEENLLLAAAAAVDARGEFPAHLSWEETLRLARAAAISQHLFSGRSGAGFDAYVSAEHTIDGSPALEESVLAPRTLVTLVAKVARSNGAISVERALSRFLEGIMHREDRAVLTMIVQGQGFVLGSTPSLEIS